SQVLAYQEQLASDFDVHILSFERPGDWAHREERSLLTRRMTRAGIHWHPLRYHRRFSVAATSWDILAGVRLARRLAGPHGLDILRARSYIASVIASSLKPAFGTSYLFDMRGFWADERVDGGLWRRNGSLY